MHALNI